MKKKRHFFAGKASCRFKGCLQKKDPGYAPKKVKVYVSRRGDINHASKIIKRRKLKGKEVENVYEKKSGERGGVKYIL